MKKRHLLALSVFAVIIFAILVAFIGLPAYFFKTGVNAYNKKDYKTAYKNFSNALLLNKSNSNYRYYYVQTLAKFKPTYKVQKEMCEIANDIYKDGAHVFAGIQINLWKNNINHQYGSNYIEQAPMGKDIIRWNPSTFPLKVYIAFEQNSMYPEWYNSEITKAFGQWAASSGFIQFNFIDKPSAADIVVELKGAPDSGCKESGCKYVVAHTEPVIKNNILKQMIITIYDKDATGAFFSDKQLYNTVLHEIGHALGIMGHSYSTDDLMYMANQTGVGSNTFFIEYRSDFQYISVKDISTLKLLYNLVPTITNTPLSEINTSKLLDPAVVLGDINVRTSQKIKEAKNYIAEAPDLPNGYIDLGIAYDEAGNIEKALAAFQEAYNKAKNDTDKYIILYDIAAMYLNNNNPDSAFEYAKQAQSIKNSDEIMDLLSNIEHARNTNSKPFWMPNITR